MSGCFFDTSVLLGGIVDFGPEMAANQKIMAAIAAGSIPRPATAWHCCLEFYAVATRLPVEFRLTPRQATQLVEQELLGRFEVHELPVPAREDFVRSAATEHIAGGRLYDAHIGEIARHAGAQTLVTDNLRHFAFIRRYGVDVYSARDFAAANL